MSRRWVASWAAVVLACGFATACGDDSEPGGGSGGGAAKGDMSLTVAIPITDPVFGYTYLAQTLGYFDEAGVEVKTLDAQGTLNLMGTITSNKADLVNWGPSNALVPSAEGNPASIVFALNGGGITLPLAVLADSPYQELEDLAGKTVGTIGATGSALGMAELMADHIEQEGLEPFTVKTFGDPAALNGALVSGGIDAASGPQGWFQAKLETDEYRLILNPTDSSDRTLILDGFYPESSLWGMNDVLKEKRDAVVAYLEGIVKADAWAHENDAQAQVTELRKTAIFKDIPEATLLKGVEWQNNFLTPCSGYISQDTWDVGFPLIEASNLGIDLQKPELQYDKIVDTSYLTDALGKANIEIDEACK